jgi:hypothetical protein
MVAAAAAAAAASPLTVLRAAIASASPSLMFCEVRREAKSDAARSCHTCEVCIHDKT